MRKLNPRRKKAYIKKAGYASSQTVLAKLWDMRHDLENIGVQVKVNDIALAVGLAHNTVYVDLLFLMNKGLVTRKLINRTYFYRALRRQF